jgi:MoaA/NifB/PqqE/SkfB family radical SAM enzyme
VTEEGSAMTTRCPFRSRCRGDERSVAAGGLT